MKAIILINPTKRIPADFVPALAAELAGLGFAVEEQQTVRGYSPPQGLATGDIVFALGGDGTVLQAAHRAGVSASIVGIHFGHLGFLCGIRYAPETWRDALRETLRAAPSKRHTLSIRMPGGGTHHALNDITVERQDGNTVHLGVAFQGNSMAYTADGVIFATATGSTAYNLAAGGPVLTPNSHLAVITPICPHTLTNRSLVLDAPSLTDMRVSLRGTTAAKVLLDGIPLGTIKHGEQVTLFSDPRETRNILLPPTMSALEQVQRAFQWSGDRIQTLH